MFDDLDAKGGAVTTLPAVARVDVDLPAVVRVDVDRAAVARAVLARAEERTGASRVRRAPACVPAVVDHRPAPHPDEVRCLPVSASLAGLLPSGGLDRGATLAVVGSTSLVLALLAETSRTGSWVAVVGLPSVGVLAAAQTGLVLDRLVLVPDPGPDGPLAVAALLDGVDVVVVGPRTALADADRRRLSARARERGAVLLATTTWPGAGVLLTAQTVHWEGLGRGHGRLRSRRLVVRRTGRAAAAQVWQGEVVLPPGPGAQASAAQPSDRRRVG